jgi:predicted dehydrogenase
MTAAQMGVLLISGKLTHQENYAPLFHADPRCTLVGLSDEADITPERAHLNREYALEMGIPYWPDLDQALARDDVQIVSVCAEPERRARIVARCARAGKHVYIDKPMSPYPEAADDAAAAVEAAGVRSQMFSFNHQPWVQRARRVVDSGELGELVAIHADNLFAKGPAGTAILGTPRQATFPPTISIFVDAKAELYVMGVYALALVCMLSERRVQTVYAGTANYFFAAHQQHGVEDFGFLCLTMEGGMTATITGGRVGWTSHPDAGTNQLYLVGTQQSLLVDAYGPRLEIYNNEPPWTPPQVNPRDPMAFWRSTQQEVNTLPKSTFAPLPNTVAAHNDVSHFVDCIVEGRESQMNARHAALLTEILLAGYHSAALGQVVSLERSRPQGRS